MSDRADAYWLEAFEVSMDEAGCGHLLVQMTDDERANVAGGIEGCHENYGLAFYSPPASDRIASVEREWEAKYKRLEKEFDQFREFAGQKMGRALKLRSGDPVSLSPDRNAVYLNDGRGTEVFL